MILLLAFAFLSGIITILSPCILPLLPIVLSSGLGGGKARPLGVVSGFVLSFSFFTLALAAIVEALGIPADSLRWLAVFIILAFGLVMLIPRLGGLFEKAASRIADLGSPSSGAAPVGGGAELGKASERRGFWSGLLVGLGLGLVWTPCVGPIMASVISLSLTARVDGGAALIALAYSLGSSLPMFAVMVGGRGLLKRLPWLSRNAGRLQRGFGLVMILVGIGIAFQWDRALQTALLRAFPGYGAGLTALEELPPVRAALAEREKSLAGPASPGSSAFAPAAGEALSGRLGDYGPAPEISAPGPWLGSPPLSLEALRGKVVLLDFWTYSCVNCIRTLPWLQAWQKAYEKAGLVIVGAHTPEFAFERERANVERAMRELGVTWPVVQDNDYGLWSAWKNRYWPAHYLIDAEGRLRYWQFGEGSYAETEAAIRALLAEAAPSPSALIAAAALPPPVSPKDAPLYAGTPETYLGYARGRGFASAVEPVSDRPIDYRPARRPGNGEWNLAGSWTIGAESVSPEGKGALELGFEAKDVYLAIEPALGGGGRVRAFVDGLPAPDTVDLRGGGLEPQASRLYHIVGLPEAGAHLLRLEVEGPLKLFAFTFG